MPGIPQDSRPVQRVIIDFYCDSQEDDEMVAEYREWIEEWRMSKLNSSLTDFVNSYKEGHSLDSMIYDGSWGF